jgi:hypothetical protein
MPIAPVSPSPLMPIAISFVREHRAGADRRHPSVDGVEAVRASPEKYAGLLLEQPMPESFDDSARIDAHFIERVDDALGDRVVPTSGAERRLAAFVSLRFQSDPIDFRGVPCVTKSPVLSFVNSEFLILNYSAHLLPPA